MSTYLPGLSLAVPQLIGKVLTVPPEDTVWELPAHQPTGLIHNGRNWKGLVLIIQAVVYFPLVSPHHIPQVLSLHHSLLSQDRHHAVGAGTWDLSYK